MNKRSLIFSLLLVITLPPATSLAETNLDYLFAMSLEEVLKVKVTGSTLTPKELKTVPAAVTVFTHQQIQNLALDNLYELMNLVPGFQSFRTSGSSMYYSYSSRGRNISGDGAEVLILIDGMRLAEGRASGSNRTAPNYPLSHIERVEFIRGPGSAVYGSNAMLGVVNIITRIDLSQASLAFGSFDRRQGQLHTSGYLGQMRLNLLASLEVDDGDNYTVFDTFDPSPTPALVDTQDPRKLAHVNLKLEWQDTRIQLLHNHSKEEDFYQVSNVSNEFNKLNTEFSALSIQQDFSWWGMDSRLWLSHSHLDEQIFSQGAAPGAFLGISNPDSGDAFYGDIIFNGDKESRLQWHNDWAKSSDSSVQFGLEYRHIEIPAGYVDSNFDISDVASQSIPIRFYGDEFGRTIVIAPSSRDVFGLYGQYQHELTDQAQLTLGVRYDDFSNIGNHLSPRFAWVQEINHHHSIKFLYGEAFRAPTESDLKTKNNLTVQGNPNLKPETVQTAEIIWLGQWSDTGVSLGYFENHYEDAIVRNQSGGIAVFENREQGPTKGFELELSHQFNEHWFTRASYSHFHETPDSAYRGTDQMASLGVNYQHLKWNANLVASYHHERDNPVAEDVGPRPVLDGYWLAFAKVQHQFNRQWQSFLQVKNLLDETYQTPAQLASVALADGIPNRGREILVGLTWKY